MRRRTNDIRTYNMADDNDSNFQIVPNVTALRKYVKQAEDETLVIYIHRYLKYMQFLGIFHCTGYYYQNIINIITYLREELIRVLLNKKFLLIFVARTNTISKSKRTIRFYDFISTKLIRKILFSLIDLLLSSSLAIPVVFSFK